MPTSTASAAPQGNTVAITVTSASSTAVQAPNAQGTNFGSGNYLLQAVGTVSPVFVAVTPAVVNNVLTSSATAAAAVIPVNGTPANGFPIPTGAAQQITLSPGCWFTTIDSGAGTTLYITPCG